MRGEFLKIKSLNYVKVAKSMGMSHCHILFRQILPNGLTPVITLLPFQIIGGIGALTALDFLGFGLQPPTPSWGHHPPAGVGRAAPGFSRGHAVVAQLSKPL